MSARKSLGTHLNHNDATFYDGPASQYSVISEGAPYANANTVNFPISFWWNNHSSQGNFRDLMAYSWTPYLVRANDNYPNAANDNSKLIYVVSTANRTFGVSAEDILKYGYIHNPDESMDRMNGWKAVTEKNNAVEYVKPNRELGLWKSAEFIPGYDRFPAMTIVNVPITKLEGEVPINKAGYYVSKIGNLEQDFRDIIFTNYFFEKPGHNPETVAYIEFMGSKGLWPERDIKYIGVNNFDAVAATYHNGIVALVASKDIYDKALRIAKAYGLEGEEAVKYVKRAIWCHEFYHVFNREMLSERNDEIRVGEYLAEFFGDRASLVDEKLARIYRAMERENKDYAEGWRSGRIRGRTLKSKLEHLARKYQSEAKAKGLDGKEARDSSKLEEEIERATGLDLIINEESYEIAANDSEKESYSDEGISSDYESIGKNIGNKSLEEKAANDNEAADDNNAEPAEQSEAA